MKRLAFQYHKSLAPMLWVFLALVSVELFAVHLLVSLWSRTAAFILSALSLLAIGWIMALIRSFRLRPVLIDDEGVLIRLGFLREILLPWADIGGFRTSFDSETLKNGVLNLALMAYPNLLIDLANPYPGRRIRQVRAMAIRLDDPAGFLSATWRFRPATGAVMAD